MKRAEALAIVGGLSKASKMPCDTYNLPAAECKIGAILRQKAGSACHGCYAFKGRFGFDSVQRAAYRRLATITDPQWVEAMVTLIKGQPYFRWHASGDIQDLAHFANIVRVAERCPETKFWIPTRETPTVRQWIAAHGPLPANLTVRVSAAMVDQPAPDLGLPTSTIRSRKAAPLPGAYVCPAPTQANSCGPCRACWDPNVANVSYKKH